MAVLFLDGFDKYGPAGQTTPTVANLLTAGEWTSPGGQGREAIAAGLSASGYALSFSGGPSGIAAVTRSLGLNYGRLIGGVRFSSNLFTNACEISFLDTATVQFTILVLNTGAIRVLTGADNGTTIATSSATVTANSTHYLEWDVTFGPATGGSPNGSYQIWLDGVSILGPSTAATRITTNVANQFRLLNNATAGGLSMFDDLYLFDSTGTTNNAPLLNTPVVETAFPSADTATKAWNNGASIIGLNNSVASATNAPGANQVFLRSFTASANMTLNSVSCVPMATSAAAKFKAVVYAGITAGSARIAEGTEVVGATSGATLTAPFSAGQSLTGGTTYAIGFITDTSVALAQADAAATGSRAANTYTSNSPAPLPAMTTAQASWQIWGNCTGAASDYASVNINPPPDDVSYIYETTVADQEMFGFPALTTNPASIACVAIKARLKRSDSGARTVDVRCASGASDTAGTASAITVGTSYGWLGNYQPTDPATGSAWTGTAVNSAKGGVRIAS